MKSSQIIAVVITLAAVGWIASGQIDMGDLLGVETSGTGSPSSVAEEGEPRRGPDTEKLQQVRVTRLQARPMTQLAIVMGHTEADKRVELRAEIIGRVTKTLADKGHAVAAGDPIVRIDVEDRQAALDEARALVHQRRIERDAAQRLTQKGFNSEIRLAEAEAALSGAQAQLRRAEVAMAHTTVSAPFDGILEDRLVEIGDYVMEGDALAVIVTLDPLIITGHVTEREVVKLTRGTPAHAALIDGSDVDGTLTYISQSAASDTRTYRVEVEVPNPEGTIPDGLTARLTLPLDVHMAHKVSPSVLNLSDDGTVGVKVVDDDNRVRFLPVTILGDTVDGIWLGNLPDEIALITVGHDFVVPGEVVVPQWSEPLLAARDVE